MKKNILIILTLIVAVLLGIWLYMTTEESKYTEKYEINKEEEHIHQKDLEFKQIENLEEKNNDTNKIIPELEDLSTGDYTLYSLVSEDYLKAEQKKENNINLDDFSLDIKAKGNFSMIDNLNKSINVTHFFNDKRNISGTIYYIDMEYNDENIAQLYKEYKESDISINYGEYASYNFGDIVETSYKNLKGVYNISEFSTIIEDTLSPVKKRFIAYFNYEGKMISIYLTTYKNCSYGQMSFEELLDLAIDF